MTIAVDIHVGKFLIRSFEVYNPFEGVVVAVAEALPVLARDREEGHGIDDTHHSRRRLHQHRRSCRVVDVCICLLS